MRLDRITEADADSFLVSLAEKGYAHGTANTTFKTFRLMMDYAYKKRLIKANPCALVGLLRDTGKERVVLTRKELFSLFPADWTEIWDDFIGCAANKLAAHTGMRVGEVLGLRGEYVHKTYITVCGQFGAYGYKAGTKTKKNRDIPIPQKVYQDLGELMKLNEDCFVFSANGGVTPENRLALATSLNNALLGIGITGEEIKKRGLTFHSWRHFLNTTMRLSNVPDSKVQAVTGHITKEMTEHYTHFVSTELREVIEVQENLLSPDEITKTE
jgi:integrase